jgi:addiction module HigA family antidote
MILLESARKPEWPDKRILVSRSDTHDTSSIILARDISLCWPRRGTDRLPGLSLKAVTMTMKNHPHPGELLREDVLAPLGIEVTQAARRLGVSRTTLSRVIHGHSGISPDLAIRLEQAGVSSARFWMNLQANYELSKALQRGRPVVQRLQTSSS